MGRAHSNAYHRVNQFFDTAYQPVLKAIAARDQEKTKKFADRWGWERVERNWHKLVEAADIDAIDICSPNNTHHEIALAAAAAGKMVLCEKPLAMDLAQAREMTRAGEKTGKPNMRSEEHTSELQSQSNLVCRLLLEKKKKKTAHVKTVEPHTPSL